MRILIGFGFFLAILLLETAACAQMNTPKQALGAQIEIVSVGARKQLFHTLFPASSIAQTAPGGFGFGWNETRLAPDETALRDSRVKLLAVIGPQGQHLSPQAGEIVRVDSLMNATGIFHADSRFWQSERVNPHWPHLDAVFEITAREITPKERGQIYTPFTMEIPLPKEGRVNLNTEIVGEKETRIRLKSIEKKADLERTWRITYELAYFDEPLRSDFWFRFEGDDKSLPQNRKVRSIEYVPFNSNKNEGQIEISVRDAPTTLNWSSFLVESNPLWRDESKFARVHFRIPVAKIAQEAALSKPGNTPLILKEGEIWPMRIERFPAGHFQAKLLFLPRKTTQHTFRAKDFRAQIGGESIRISQPSPEIQRFWFDDGRRAPVPFELWFAYRSAPANEQVLGAKTIEISGVIETHTIPQRHFWRGIPIPPNGHIRKITAQPSGTWQPKTIHVSPRDARLHLVFSGPETTWNKPQQVKPAQIVAISDEHGYTTDLKPAELSPKRDYSQPVPQDNLWEIVAPLPSRSSRQLNIELRDSPSEKPLKTTHFSGEFPIRDFVPQPRN